MVNYNQFKEANDKVLKKRKWRRKPYIDLPIEKNQIICTVWVRNTGVDVYIRDLVIDIMNGTTCISNPEVFEKWNFERGMDVL
ncbi:MAG: hypothetical protein IJ661_08290 [Lachnospiraceae bacterium]|nr:hypothetical protein [Lachnospiraceae bacterium]